MIEKGLRILAERGPGGVLLALKRLALPLRAGVLPLCVARVRHRRGLEIGGPSAIFGNKGLLPLYARVGHLDNCNFSAHTVWVEHHEEGATFRFDRRRPAGRQFIAEATRLEPIASKSCDFVLSSHALEHCANPLQALREIKRVLADSGTLILVLPHREGTFDHRRPVTSLQHLIEDDRRGMAEDDLTHLPEILALHDFERDPEAGGPQAFEARARSNAENRCLHHHVFDEHLAAAMVTEAGLDVLAVEFSPPMHIIVVAGKGVPLQSP